jgi:predicted amidohydrolase
VKLAVAQMAPVLGDLEANLAKVREMQEAALARGADLVVFPELALTGYATGDCTAALALTRDHPLFGELLRLGARLPLGVGFIERGPGGQVYNTVGLFAEGEARHLHRKVYLPTYRHWEEGKHFARGRGIRVTTCASLRLSILICNDLWHPSLAYLAALQGSELLLVPANSILDPEGQNPAYWDLLLRFTATFYGCYVAFANRVGEEAGRRYWGGSTVLAPDGSLGYRAGRNDEVFLVDIDREQVFKARDRLPVLRDENPHLTLCELQRILRDMEEC